MVDCGLGGVRKCSCKGIVEDDIAVEAATEGGREGLFAVGLVGEEIGLAELATTAVRIGDAGGQDDIGLDTERREVRLRVRTVDDGDATAAKGVYLT